MYVGFGRFLLGLTCISVILGGVFGAGAAFGAHNDDPAAASPSTAARATGTARAGAGGGDGVAAFGAATAAAGGQSVTGVVENVTPTSMNVRTANGTIVGLALSAQTTVRKSETGTLEDVKAGANVVVQRDPSMTAMSVQLVAAGERPASGRPASAAGGNAGATVTR